MSTYLNKLIDIKGGGQINGGWTGESLLLEQFDEDALALVLKDILTTRDEHIVEEKEESNDVLVHES